MLEFMERLTLPRTNLDLSIISFTLRTRFLISLIRVMSNVQSNVVILIRRMIEMTVVTIYSKNGKKTCKPFEVNTPDDPIDEVVDLPIPDVEDVA